MNITNAFPFQLHWTSQELAAAVPLRLFELIDFAAGADACACANAESPRERTRRGRSYLPAPALAARFRVRG